MGGFQDPKLAKLREARAIIRAFLLVLEHDPGCANDDPRPSALTGKPLGCTCRYRQVVKRSLDLLSREV